MKIEEFEIKLNAYMKSENCKLIKYTTIGDMLGNTFSTIRYTYIVNNVVFEDFVDLSDENNEYDIFESVRIKLKHNKNKLKENL